MKSILSARQDYSDCSDSSASTSTNSSSASQANSPPTVARPVPFPARADMRPEEDLEVEHVARQHLPPEPRPLDATEQRELAGEALVGQHRHPAQLGQCLHHQDAGKGWAPGKVTGKERFVTGEVPRTPSGLARLHRVQLGDEQKGIPVGNEVFGSHGKRHYWPIAECPIGKRNGSHTLCALGGRCALAGWADVPWQDWQMCLGRIGRVPRQDLVVLTLPTLTRDAASCGDGHQ